MAPGHTWPQGIFVSGRYLRSSANIRLVIASDTTVLVISNTIGGKEKAPLANLSAAAKPAPTTRETNKRNPTARTMPKLKMRCRNSEIRPLNGLGLYMPDSIQRITELRKDARCAEKQDDKSHSTRDDSRRWFLGRLDNHLDGLGAFRAHELRQLTQQRLLRRVAAEHDSGDPNNYDKQRRQRK